MTAASLELLDAEDRLMEAACTIARHQADLAPCRAQLLRWRCHTLSRLLAAHLSHENKKLTVGAVSLLAESESQLSEKGTPM